MIWMQKPFEFNALFNAEKMHASSFAGLSDEIMTEGVGGPIVKIEDLVLHLQIFEADQTLSAASAYFRFVGWLIGIPIPGSRI